MKHCTQAGINMIKKFEGLRLEAYTDTAGVRTIGYGHAYWNGTQKIDQKTADRLLMEDIAKAENDVNHFDYHYNFTQNQFDALTSFAFNVGTIDGLTKRAGRTIGQISESILLYCYSGGKKIPGLLRRREEEKAIFDKNKNVDYGRIADEVLAGKYGNGEERKLALETIGIDYNAVQDIVNTRVMETNVKKAAYDVISGKYGNGNERVKKLTNAGYNYTTVQYYVNQILQGNIV